MGIFKDIGIDLITVCVIPNKYNKHQFERITDRYLGENLTIGFWHQSFERDDLEEPHQS